MARKPRTRRKRRKPAPRQRYAVNIAMKAWDIAKAGAALTLTVREHDELLGTIEIGQGTFGWKSARGKKGFRRIEWRRFAAQARRGGMIGVRLAWRVSAALQPLL